VESFVDEVLKDILSKELDISQQVFILPSKRAGAFLKHSLSQLTEKTIFSPEILSIEQYIENVSLLKTISNTELLFEFYQVYKENTPKDQLHDFDSYCKWAQVMVQDFNEVDRYLVPPDKIFNYLSAIKEVDHWSVSAEKTELISNYLSFWKKLPLYYTELTKRLIDKGTAYQGLMYREAVNKLELYLQLHSKERFVFLGFNALNTAEQKIIQELLHQDVAQIYWDIDHYFVDSSFHDAGLFTRRYKHWPYFQKNEFKWECDSYRSKKNIKTIGVPKKVSQAKYVGELLSQLNSSHKNLLNTAVVLGDETLLTPLLNSIPEEIGPVNVTMGLSLKDIPLASLFELLFRIHKVPDQANLYYKHVLSLTSNPFISQILNINETENIAEVHQIISKNNITYIGLDQLKSNFPSNTELIDLLFSSWNGDSLFAIKNCKEIIRHIKNCLSDKREENQLALEHLYRFMQVFNQVEVVISEYEHVKDVKSLYSLYKELLASENLDFQGEPLKGLQILGVLESRVIDFETVIITSVNEGILPSGKSHNSFIPYDVKMEYGLPTYKEKDAVYTYHFYHLLQRAKNIYILYNTEVDAMNGGEKSRFIAQLEAEKIHEIEDVIITPQVRHIDNRLKSINKTDDIIDHLKDLAKKGFSPSALTSYIRNPLDFYFNKVLQINSFDDIEETVATNTFGTIIHNSLEELYKP
ncbi:MAG: PD-(D/E)XK nuclease family protein, partial [Flavobacteriaceae bacterium]